MDTKVQKIAAHVLIKNGDKYLITRRSLLNDWKPGEWDLPGGTIEFGEDPVEAAKREVKEETGLVVEIGRPIHLYATLSSSTRHQFQLVYEAILQGGEVTLNPEEHDRAEWCTLEEMEGHPMIAFLESLYAKVLKPQED